MEFIYYTELQKIFIDRTIEWLTNVIQKGVFKQGGVSKDKTFENMVHSYFSFYVFLHVFGGFSYVENERKEATISKLKTLFTES